MKSKEIEKKLIKHIKEITNNKKVNLQSEQHNTHGWDSLAYMSIVSMVEKEFNIEISYENIKNFNSVNSIINIIKNV